MGVKFVTDNQTVKDLQIFDNHENNFSVFYLFDHTKSDGGKERLEELFEEPLADIKALNTRCDILKYIQQMPCFIEINREELRFIEHYLAQDDCREKYSVFHALYAGLMNKIKPENAFYVSARGVRYLGMLIHALNRFFQDFTMEGAPIAVKEYRTRILDLIQKSGLRKVLKVEKTTLLVCAELDHCFRRQEVQTVRELLKMVYELDALKSVTEVAKKYNFSYPDYLSVSNEVILEEVFHPFLTNAVTNNFKLTDGQQVCFLTGPNMAGKSTYMKSVGIAVYLAHLGFPVPAKHMRTSVFKGLFTTINLSDSLSRGYSHYYSEVMRVKYVAEQISVLKDVFVIFDELFRGTNVKDAYDASLAVITAFAGLRRSLFVVSTHIFEVAEQLYQHSAVDFRFFEIIMDANVPCYTYQLKSGVTDERIGMYILNREKVIETINEVLKD